jgi:salicylate hydroxylase
MITLPDSVQQYALFAGPKLTTVVSDGSLALVGDASHRTYPGFQRFDYWLTERIALSGAFGKAPTVNALGGLRLIS